MHHASPYISQQISRYILNKAKQLHSQSLKIKVIQSLSRVQASKFPTDCTLQMMSLFNSKPDSSRPASYNEESLIRPSISKKKLKIKYISAISTPHLKKSSFNQFKCTSRNSRKSGGSRGSLKSKNSNCNKENLCQPLLCKEEEDEEIQILRLKKQKLFTLDTYFKESQREQKNKSNKIDKYSKMFYTTDYNGDPLELKFSMKSSKKESNLFVQINPKIRQQKIQNLRFPTDQTYEGSMKIDNDQKDDSKPNPSKRAVTLIDQKKLSKLSDKQEIITLKKLQSEAISHQRLRRQRKPKQNTSELPSIALIKYI